MHRGKRAKDKEQNNGNDESVKLFETFRRVSRSHNKTVFPKCRQHCSFGAISGSDTEKIAMKLR